MTIRELITRYTFKSDTKPIVRLDNAVAGLKARVVALDQRIISGFKTAAKVMAVGAAAAGVAIIKAASDAQESEDMFRDVFKEEEAQVRQWSETLANQMGRSGYKVREFAANLQDTFVPLGFARDTAAQLSKNLVELGMDVASFKNKSEPEVINAFTSALVGNHEAVRSLGLAFTAADLDEKIKALKKTMPGFTKLGIQQQKMMGRYYLILERSADAHGNATSTAGSFANQMKRLRALVQDVAIKIGMKLLPMATKWVNLAGNWIKENEKLIQQKVGEFLEGMISAFRTLGKVAAWVIEHWRTLATVLAALVAGRILFGLASMVKTVWSLASALKSVVGGAQAASGALGAATGTAGKLAGALGKVGAVGAALGAGWAIGSLLDKWLGLSDKISDKLMETQRRLSEAKRPVLALEASHRSLVDQAKQYAELSTRGVKSVQTAGGERVELNRENIQRLLQASAKRMGYAGGKLGPDFAANILKNVPTGAGQAPLAPAGPGGTKNEVKVEAPRVEIKMPSGTTAEQARRLGEETSAALLVSLRRAMGDVQR